MLEGGGGGGGTSLLFFFFFLDKSENIQNLLQKTQPNIKVKNEYTFRGSNSANVILRLIGGHFFKKKNFLSKTANSFLLAADPVLGEQILSLQNYSRIRVILPRESAHLKLALHVIRPYLEK